MIVDIAVFDLNSYDSFGGVVPIVVRKGAECTLVTIVPDTLAPGDTAAVLVMKRQTDGTVVPYPPETLFSVTLLAGQGTLIGPSGDTSSTMLECVEQGFRYVAPDSITGSSLETHISAVVAEGCGGLRPVGGQSAGKMKDKGEETPRLSLVECPVFASVVVKEGCEPCPPPEGALAQIPRDPNSSFFTINGPIAGLEGCNEPHSGSTWTAGVTQLGPWASSAGLQCLNPYVTNLHFEINCGYCFQNFPEPYRDNIVDESLSILTNVTQARDAIADFITSTESGEYSGKKYYSLLRTGCHEQYHTGQYVGILWEVFNEALQIINGLPPVDNWCLLTGQALDDATRERSGRANEELSKAMERFEVALKVRDLETDAYRTGYYCVREVVIPAIKQRFGLQ
jgi:hypothetical protein